MKPTTMKPKLLLLAVWLVAASVCYSATVTGTIKDSLGGTNANMPTKLRATPLSTPATDPTDNGTILDYVVTTGITNRAFSMSLRGGLYDCDFGNPNKTI